MSPDVRSLSAVLLRRNLPLGEPMLLSKLSLNLQQGLKQGLLQALVVEPYTNTFLLSTLDISSSLILFH